MLFEMIVVAQFVGVLVAECLQFSLRSARKNFDFTQRLHGHPFDIRSDVLDFQPLEIGSALF